MVASGHLPLLLLFFLLYSVIPSNGLSCLMRFGLLPKDKEFTRQQAVSELKKLFGNENDMAKIRASFNGPGGEERKKALMPIVTKSLMLALQAKAYEQECQQQETCCIEEGEYKEPKLGTISMRMCSSKCFPDYQTVMKVCQTDMCNKNDYNGPLEKVKPGIDIKSLLDEQALMTYFLEISYDVSPGLGDSMKQMMIAKGYKDPNAPKSNGNFSIETIAFVWILTLILFR